MSGCARFNSRWHGFGRFVPGRLEHLAHLETEIVLAQDQARGRLFEARARANLADALAEQRLQTLHDGAVRLILGTALGLVLRRVEPELAARHVFERPARKLGQILHHPFVYAIDEQQDFDTPVPKDLEMRTALRCRQRVGNEIENPVLPFTGRLDVCLERSIRLVASRCGRMKPQQLRNTLFVGWVFGETLLEDISELAPNVSNLSGSSLASLPIMSSTRFVSAERIAPTCGSCCNSSRDTFKDKSLASTTPRTKRKYRGKK